jgi:hypothetical protein
MTDWRRLIGVLATQYIRSNFGRETIMEETFSPPGCCVDGKKKELIEPQVAIFRTDIPSSQYHPLVYLPEGALRRKQGLRQEQTSP